MKSWRAARLLKILDILRTGEPVTAMWIGNRLNVSERSIYRDIIDLREQGHRIDGSAGHGGGMRLRKPRKEAA